MAADVSTLGEVNAQVFWWIKVLRDDPLRVVRALRFAAKLSFRLHESFWSAVPFATRALRGKVAGNRKLTEILKIAKYGPKQLQSFLVLAFSRRFRTGLGGGAGAREEEVGEQSVLASALFGGVPRHRPKGKKGGKKKKKGGAHMGGQGSGDGAAKIEEASDRVCTLPPVVRFNSSMFERLCASLQPHVDNVSPDESLGLHFVAALSCAGFTVQEGGVNFSVETLSHHFHCCCDGLSASNAMRQAGHTTLEAVALLCQSMLK